MNRFKGSADEQGRFGELMGTRLAPHCPFSGLHFPSGLGVSVRSGGPAGFGGQGPGGRPPHRLAGRPSGRPSLFRGIPVHPSQNRLGHVCPGDLFQVRVPRPRFGIGDGVAGRTRIPSSLCSPLWAGPPLAFRTKRGQSIPHSMAWAGRPKALAGGAHLWRHHDPGRKRHGHSRTGGHHHGGAVAQPDQVPAFTIAAFIATAAQIRTARFSGFCNPCWPKPCTNKTTPKPGGSSI